MDATQKKSNEVTQKQLDFIADLTKQKDWAASAEVTEQMAEFNAAPSKRGASALISAMLDLEDKAAPSAVSLVHQAISEAVERRTPKEGECLILGQAECRLLLDAISTQFCETDGSVELHELDCKIREFLGMEPTALPEYLK